MGFNILVILGCILSLICWRLINGSIFRVLQKKLGDHKLFLLEKVIFYTGSLGILFFSLHLLSIHLGDLLATAGIVTIAIGFASKTAIANFISGVILLSSKKISISDLIQVDDYVGVVENIDIFATKIRTFDNVLLNIPNEKLMTEYIHNFSRYNIRRVIHEFLIHYEDFDVEVTDLLKDSLDQIPNVLVEPAPFLVISNHLGRGVNISVRVWCESTLVIQTQNALVTYCIEFLKNHSIHHIGEYLDKLHPSVRYLYDSQNES